MQSLFCLGTLVFFFVPVILAGWIGIKEIKRSQRHLHLREQQELGITEDDLVALRFREQMKFLSRYWWAILLIMLIFLSPVCLICGLPLFLGT
jgi:hypothetical protein